MLFTECLGFDAARWTSSYSKGFWQPYLERIARERRTQPSTKMTLLHHTLLRISTSVTRFHCKWGFYFTKQHCRRVEGVGLYPLITYLCNGTTLLDKYVSTLSPYVTFPQHNLSSLDYMGTSPREFLPPNSKESQQ